MLEKISSTKRLVYPYWMNVYTLVISIKNQTNFDMNEKNGNPVEELFWNGNVNVIML